MSRVAKGSSRPRAPERGAPREESSVAIDRGGALVALRLAIGKDGLGIELARPVSTAAFDVVELVIRLPNVRFPFDVTGGVAKFRHRRGELERLAVELDGRRLARWAEPRLRGLVSTEPCVVTIAPRAFGATVGIVSKTAALAFEVALVGETDLVLAVHGARGAGLNGPPTTLAQRALGALLGDVAKREGARFRISRAAERLGRALLPDAGVRAPNGADIVLQASGESDGVLFLSFGRAPSRATFPPAATLAHEATLLTRQADDARYAGDYERARQLDLGGLERAPRHPELARRIAEVDAYVGGRAEAAIATLRSVDRMPLVGRLMGDLLFETGDVAAAIASYLREGERDPSAGVAALCYAQAARLTDSPSDALAWLDSAVARAPTLPELRWERGTRRLVQGRIADARADFQELEALAVGPRDRHDVLRRAADIHRAHGLGADAAVLYERALLYRPEDPAAIAGLGAAIAAEGRAPRGAALLTRAIAICEALVPPLPTAWIELALAKVLAERLGDRSSAVAHLRVIPDETEEAIEARGLEGRYRALLGDAAGASLAFARLRERAGRAEGALAWLEEAARFEESRGELALAQSHLAAALAVAPESVAVEARYRDLGERIARERGIALPITPLAPPEVRIAEKPDPAARERITVVAPPEGAAARERATLAAPPDGAPAPEEDELKVEELTRKLQADPNDEAVVDELIVRLTRLGRTMELFALLSARLEDAPEERRAALLPRHREVLERLEREARAAGRDGEAELFRMAREST